MDVFERRLGPRPQMTLVIMDAEVAEIWVEGRAPTITLRDYDWGQTDPGAPRDQDGFPFTPITWRRPAWALGLSLHLADKGDPYGTTYPQNDPAGSTQDQQAEYASQPKDP